MFLQDIDWVNRGRMKAHCPRKRFPRNDLSIRVSRGPPAGEVEEIIIHPAGQSSSFLGFLLEEQFIRTFPSGYLQEHFGTFLRTERTWNLDYFFFQGSPDPPNRAPESPEESAPGIERSSFESRKKTGEKGISAHSFSNRFLCRSFPPPTSFHSIVCW